MDQKIEVKSLPSSKAPKSLKLSDRQFIGLGLAAAGLLLVIVAVITW